MTDLGWAVTAMSCCVVSLAGGLLYLAHLTIKNAASQVKSFQAYFENAQLVEKARSSTEAADAISGLAHNREAVRQHAETFDTDLSAYQRAKEAPYKAKEDSGGPIIKDLETGHTIQILDA